MRSKGVVGGKLLPTEAETTAQRILGQLISYVSVLALCRMSTFHNLQCRCRSAQWANKSLRLLPSLGAEILAAPDLICCGYASRCRGCTNHSLVLHIGETFSNHSPHTSRITYLSPLLTICLLKQKLAMKSSWNLSYLVTGADIHFSVSWGHRGLPANS
jgi:hypothetical protein